MQMRTLICEGWKKHMWLVAVVLAIALSTASISSISTKGGSNSPVQNLQDNAPNQETNLPSTPILEPEPTRLTTTNQLETISPIDQSTKDNAFSTASMNDSRVPDYTLDNFEVTSPSSSQTTTQMENNNTLLQVGRSTFLKGVNYQTSHMQNIPDETIHRDFSRFQKDGINLVGLSLYWYRLEGKQKGDYNGTYWGGVPYGDCFLEHVKRFVRIAETYNIKVLITFHTLWLETGDEWCTPDYVVDAEGHNTQVAIVKDENMKQAFLDLVNHTVTYLKNENIFAWALLNEPWNAPDYIESFIDLIQKGAAMIREIDGNSQVTAKFISSSTWTRSDGTNVMKNHFGSVFNWDQRIFDALDFISLDCYIKYPELYDTWVNITRENVNVIVQRGKNAVITEFGWKSDDDSVQAEYYKRALDAFDDMPVSGWIAWCWNQYCSSGIGKGWTLQKDNEGNPRRAYEELLEHHP